LELDTKKGRGAMIKRYWAMPNSQTFLIKPIAELLMWYVPLDNTFIDPFSGHNSPAKYTNDLNPQAKTKHHLEALDFCKLFENATVDGVLFDPPYSPRQISECYKGLGMKTHMKLTQSSFYSKVKNEAALKIKLGGLALCFGWNSQGFGLTRGFEMLEILLVAHGGAHNDTIVTVERKVK
jgi:hypothetical protein